MHTPASCAVGGAARYDDAEGSVPSFQRMSLEDTRGGTAVASLSVLHPAAASQPGMQLYGDAEDPETLLWVPTT